jgi:predicted  nucleic acid-binding Zn-ribbon protein
LSLSQTDDEAIDPYIWAGEAIQASDALEDEVESLQKQLNEERAATARLREQLQSLVDAKEEHEKVLLSKFTELLNSKKLKIRDQQRMLAGAKLDPQACKSYQWVTAHYPKSLPRPRLHAICTCCYCLLLCIS